METTKERRGKRWHIADEVRGIVREKSKTLRVGRGRGTAYGWTEIYSGDKGGMFTDAEKAELTALGISFGGNFAVMDYRDARAFVREKRGGLPCETCGGLPCVEGCGVRS